MNPPLSPYAQSPIENSSAYSQSPSEGSYWLCLTDHLFLVTYRQFQKAKLKHVNAIVLRDQLRNELAKQQRIESEMQQQLEQQRLDIAKLNLMINQAEEQMVRLRTRFKAAVQHRNDR